MAEKYDPPSDSDDEYGEIWIRVNGEMVCYELGPYLDEKRKIISELTAQLEQLEKEIKEAEAKAELACAKGEKPKITEEGKGAPSPSKAPDQLKTLPPLTPLHDVIKTV